MKLIVESWQRRLCSSLALALLKRSVRPPALVNAVESISDATTAGYCFFALHGAGTRVRVDQEGVAVRHTFAFFCLQHTQAFATRARIRSVGNVCGFACSQPETAFA